MPTSTTPIFTRQHYNAIAKEIREQLHKYLVEKMLGRDADVISSTALTILAERLAKRFQADNPNFDPLKFLDACSPDVERYPLSELWEDTNV